jgi:hypothetical protein
LGYRGYVTFDNYCLWDLDLSSGSYCYFGNGNFRITTTLYTSGGVIYWDVKVNGGNSYGSFWAYLNVAAGAGSTIDCSATYTPVLYSYGSTPGYARCDNLANVTCQIN